MLRNRDSYCGVDQGGIQRQQMLSCQVGLRGIINFASIYINFIMQLVKKGLVIDIKDY